MTGLSNRIAKLEQQRPAVLDRFVVFRGDGTPTEHQVIALLAAADIPADRVLWLKDWTHTPELGEPLSIAQVINCTMTHDEWVCGEHTA